ncbi:MAG: ABC transporter ATP-binding protein [Methanomassiliicoccales archaeon]|jgi:peptide/nickel transport system ATP-binding protein|nr:ABC transporter ATP-binding protein [Methanomassiliicoccales archaeon]
MKGQDEVLLEIENLYTNFYTYQGVVKALDGINLTIKKGEAFGLVGETGCGKSVTANCILRLIPSPPGKIEKGSVFFGMPSEVRQKRIELLQKIAEIQSSDKENGKKKELEDAKKELEKIRKEYDLLSKSITYMQKIRGKYISMIFQEPMSSLNPVFTAGEQIAENFLLHERQELSKAVLENIEMEIKEIKSTKSSLRILRLPILAYYKRVYKTMNKKPDALSVRFLSRIPILRRYQKPLKQEALRRAEEMLKLVRIPDPKNVLKSYPHELSGGMQQRVTIAMALACKPRLLIADEPTTALDVTIQAQILKLMKDLQLQTGTSILLITHNLGVVAETCERVGVMYAGVMAEVGPVRSIFKEPLHPYTQGLMNSIPKLTTEGRRLDIIPGNVPNLVHPPSGCRFHPRCQFAMEVCKKEKPPMIEVRPEHFVACHLYTRRAS